MVGVLVERLRAPVEAPGVGVLTSRESDILSLVASGRTNREIASELHFSESSVKNAVSRILSKLGLRRRSEAAAYFVARTHSALTEAGSR